MRLEDLQAASFRKQFFFVTSTGITGGRKDALKTFVNSDLQSIEDLGLKQRTFTVSGIIAAHKSIDGPVSYEQLRDRLLDALDSDEGPGILIHPFHGRIDNVVCRSWSLVEDLKKVGEATIDINFAISNATGLPVEAADVLGGVVTVHVRVKEAVTEDIADNYEVTDSFTGNFGDALDKGNEIVDEINEAVAPVAVASSELDQFSAELSAFTANLASLVSIPRDLADSVDNVFITMNGLYVGTEATFRSTFDAMSRLFPFGDLDLPISTNTSSRIERQKNRDVINNAIGALALSYAYLNASQFDFETANDVDDVAVVLEDQYQALVTSGTLESEVQEQLTQQRIATADFFNETKLTKPQIVSVRTPFISTRLLAYQYYGESTLGATIARLNGLADLDGVEGNVDILSA